MKPQRLANSLWRWLRAGSKLRWLTILSLSVSVGTLAFGGAILMDMRQDALRQAEQASDNLVKALARDIARNIKVYDLSVQGAIDAWDRADIQHVSPGTRRMAFFDRAASADYLGLLAVTDASGIVVASSADSALHLNTAQRDYFRVQQERVDAELYISRPFTSQLQSAGQSIAISRRIFGHDGQFGGIVLGSIRLTLFRQMFDKLDLGSQGRVTLYRADGRLIARSPFHEADIDRDFGGGTIFRQYATSPAGNLIGTPADGVERLYAYRHIDDLPLILSIGISTAEIYAHWWHRAVAVGVALIALCGSATLLLVLFRSEILSRIAAEQQLALVASTDGLTGISNRRSSEEHLKREWRRAIRLEMPISLLMLDADFFKLFNDTYGHPAGDQVLRAIADAITRNIRRPCDEAGRYGGEEFIVLLPDTEMAGAVAVAKQIRAAVADLNIPHAGSPIEHVTISIGVATVCPVHDDPEALLMKAADEALYEAKRSGRNRVSTGVRPNLPGWLEAIPNLAG